MKEEMKISVVVPVYNVERFLRDCINSIRNQTYQNLEIILVDDGSTDSSAGICDEYEKMDTRIKVIHKCNGGLSDARNTGIGLAKGEYISFVDSDDWIRKDAYQILSDRIRQFRADIVCFGMTELYERSRNVLYLPKSSGVADTEGALKMLMLGNGCGPSACNKLFKRRIFEKIRFPAGKISEDIAVMYQVFDQAKQVGFVNECLYYYRHRRGSITTAAYHRKNLVIVDYARDMIRYMKKKHPALTDDARTYYANTLIHVCSRISALNKAEQEIFQNELKAYKNELYRYRCFLRTPAERAKYILVMTGFYGTLLNILVTCRRGNF